eukprot:SAG11_NODE_5300_length_1602_cov_2.236194_3_plen_72_part_01
MLTAGMDKCLRLFAVDGERNSLVQAVHFKDMPIHTARFTPDGSGVVLSGRARRRRRRRQRRSSRKPPPPPPP